MEMSGQIQDLAVALGKAQGAMKHAIKDSLNPHFRSKYADLTAVWEACRGPLTANGLAVVQGAEADGSKVSVTTMLTHISGQWVRSTLTLDAKDGGPQAVGSAISYARRYGLSAMVGISAEDDDAESAQGRSQMAPVNTSARQFVQTPAQAMKAVADGNDKGKAPAAKNGGKNYRTDAMPEPPPLSDSDIPF